MHQRIFIEKHLEFKDYQLLSNELCHLLAIDGLSHIRVVNIYDCYNCPESALELAVKQIFSDPVTDIIHSSLPEADFSLIIEPLPGQFDQRADSAMQCLAILDDAFKQTIVTSAQAYLFYGSFSEDEQQALKDYLLNPIETREKDLEQISLPKPHNAQAVPTYNGFINQDATALRAWYDQRQLAMTFADCQYIQQYFKAQQRNPSETEIRVLDTYWSDHCRHTTFQTKLAAFAFPNTAFGAALREDFVAYQALRHEVYGNKEADRPYTMMDLATIDAKYQKMQGHIDDVEFSAEINACSVFVEVDEDGETSPWLLQFKNETHNHPTEIEPYGGAATCIGGAIRDPLSGRAYVYQAMRLSGSADPRESVAQTIPGKLPQRIIAEGSAAGASSYGNQIGLANGQIVELYHEGYKAKHMEVGAVVGATPAEHVKRLEPQAGDVILLIGGATGRDGCGGATGSSREQHIDSLSVSAAEVQKGNPPEERKLQRLFRQKDFACRIKRCNDFGAGGVSVAIGELADGVAINLDAIPVKYQGLSGTELAISESQERMAIVVNQEDVEHMIALAEAENLSASIVAKVTNDATMTMTWQGQTIVSLSRSLLNSNGMPSVQDRVVLAGMNESKRPNIINIDINDTDLGSNWIEALKKQLASLKFADQRGLGDRFDHSVGAGAVLLPYGGRLQRSPAEASVYTLPTEGQTSTASILAYGFDPDVSTWSPYHGGLYAVIEATARLVACGGDASKAHYSLQEYFRRLGNDPKNWGLPYSALLGAHYGLYHLNRAAIGGKDSMSGSFNELHVPPTLIAFAVATLNKQHVTSPEFKQADHQLYWLRCPIDEHQRPDIAAFKQNNVFILQAIKEGLIKSVRSIRHGGIIQAIYECSIGNHIGVKIDSLEDLFVAEYGGYLISSEAGLGVAANLKHIGYTTNDGQIHINNYSESIETFYNIATAVLADIYPLYPNKSSTANISLAHNDTIKPTLRTLASISKPRVCLPVFPGTNSEFDTARAFARHGAITQETIIRNQTQNDIQRSISQLVATLKQSQILALSGGFSAGDEPDGSAKFIANILRYPSVRDAIEEFLARDGLILGICNGFQALIKCGLLPYGHIRTLEQGDATLTYNTIGRHIARVATTVVANNHSPWLSDYNIGEAHDVCFSHGEGRFMASQKILELLLVQGQIATQYANPTTLSPTLDPLYNPNGSLHAIEGITSPCGKILGKMGHSERHVPGLHRNYPNFKTQDIFALGVKAFS